MSSYNDIVKRNKKYVLQTYTRYPVALKKGKGVYVWDVNNKKYLDFIAGISVNNLGYNNKQINSIINKSLENLIHTSNLFYTEPQINLAEKLSKSTNNGKVFFCNSGAEANETALKLARAHGNRFKNPRKKIITLKNSFHGRSLATVFATGQKKYQKGFKPKVGNYTYIRPDNIKMLKKILNNDVSAVLIELIQGEGGINILDKEFVQYLYKECRKKKILFMVDEVQTGLGRTGKLFAFKYFNIIPDVITLAKSIAFGLPMGVAIIKKEFAGILKPGMHASTFGGGDLVSSAACKVIDIISKKSFLDDVQKISKYFHTKLLSLKKRYKFIIEVKGIGLMLGLKFKFPCKDVVKKLLKQGLITNCIQDNVLRFLPPLIIKKNHVDEAIQKLDKVFKTL